MDNIILLLLHHTLLPADQKKKKKNTLAFHWRRGQYSYNIMCIYRTCVSTFILYYMHGRQCRRTMGAGPQSKNCVAVCSRRRSPPRGKRAYVLGNCAGVTENRSEKSIRKYQLPRSCCIIYNVIQKGYRLVR